MMYNVPEQETKDIEEERNTQELAPNDTAYKRWSCHSGLKLLCKLCQTSQPDFWGMPAMRTRWMAGTAAHKSGWCRDQSRSDNFKQESLDLWYLP